MLSESPPAEPSEATEATSPSASPPKESEPAGTGGVISTAPWGAHDMNMLWVCNPPKHTGEDIVMAAFAPHKALDCVVMCVGSHSYVFSLFHSITKSQSTLEALRESKVKGTFIRIDFVRPVRDKLDPSELLKL